MLFNKKNTYTLEPIRLELPGTVNILQVFRCLIAGMTVDDRK